MSLAALTIAAALRFCAAVGLNDAWGPCTVLGSSARVLGTLTAGLCGAGAFAAGAFAAGALAAGAWVVGVVAGTCAARTELACVPVVEATDAALSTGAEVWEAAAGPTAIPAIAAVATPSMPTRRPMGLRKNAAAASVRWLNFTVLVSFRRGVT